MTERMWAALLVGLVVGIVAGFRLGTWYLPALLGKIEAWARPNQAVQAAAMSEGRPAGITFRAGYKSFLRRACVSRISLVIACGRKQGRPFKSRRCEAIWQMEYPFPALRCQKRGPHVMHNADNYWPWWSLKPNADWRNMAQ
jgi:hypothetical protein